MANLSIKRETTFNGPRKVGLDADTIIHILVDPALFSSVLSELAEHENLLHIHEEVKKDVLHVLARDYEWSADHAEMELNEFIKKYKLILVQKNKNNPLLTLMKEDCRVKKLTFHPPDSWIIADYKASGINKVYSGNKHFVDACNLFGIDASQTPSFDRSISDKFKELFKSGRK